MRLRVAALLVLLSVAGCQSASSGRYGAAPDFELKDLNGEIVRLSDFRGRPVLLDFWATWCGPCRMSIPMLQRFYERHRREGLVVVGLNIDEDPADVYPFVKRFGMTYPVVFAGHNAVASDYGVAGIPLFVFVAPDGRIVKRYEGFSPQMPDDWEARFAELRPAAR